MYLKTFILMVGFLVHSTLTFAFESNISREEEMRLSHEILLIDLNVGETMLVDTYEICALNGKFLMSGFSAPLGELKTDWERNKIYFKAKRMPGDKVTLEIMPRLNGNPYNEKDFVFTRNCRLLNPFLSIEPRDFIESPFEIISINGFKDARSLWESFKEINNK